MGVSFTLACIAISMNRIFHLIKTYKHDIQETFTLSLPILFGRLGAVLMGVTDNIMIGKLSYTALAAAGISNSVYIFLAIIPIGMLIVGSPMISAANGQNQKTLVANILKSCIQVSVLVSVLFAVLLWLLALNFHWFNQPPEVEALAVPYLSIVIVSIVPLMFFIAVEQFTDGLGHTKISMFFNTSALLLNVFLNWVLIYGHLGFPALELTGAAVATLLSRVYMAAGIWFYTRYNGQFKSYNLTLQWWVIERDIFKKVLKQGIPSGMQFFFEVSAFSAAAMIIGWMGAVPLAAHQIAISTCSITYMVSTGFASGGSIRVGYAYGSKNKTGVLHAGKSTLILVTFLMSVSFIGFIVFNKPIVLLYNNDVNVVEMACGLLMIGGLFQLADGIQVAAVRSLLGIEDVRIPTAITLIAYWVIGIPVGSLLAYGLNWGAYGIWAGLCLGLMVAAVLLTYRFLNKANRV